MGRGIALLLLQEIAMHELMNRGTLEGSNRIVIFIEIDPNSLSNLRFYLEDRLSRFAEKNINQLRECYEVDSNVVSNEDMIITFVRGALGMTQMTMEVEAARKAILVFESVFEETELKAYILKKAKGPGPQFFFSNTSSIPIHVLLRKSELPNNIVGVHFFNPPSVQKLIELIIPKMATAETGQLAIDLTKKLQKIGVFSADVAGFIGNGYLMREIIFASKQVEQLSKVLERKEAILLVNMITHDYLIRPMGIYQLIDYIGINTCQQILSVMSHYQQDEGFECNLINEILARGKVGGQNPDGSQRDGFFKYKQLTPVASYSFKTDSYKPFDEGGWVTDLSKGLGALPPSWKSWKQLVNEPNRQVLIEAYFNQLFESGTPGAEVTLDFLQYSKEIATHLVREGVAQSFDDVNTVLSKGFYHLYGADIPWLDLQKIFRSIL